MAAEAPQDIPITVARALKQIGEGYGVGEAAAILGVSQPAVSKGIGLLEKSLGVALLRRGSRPLTLTEEGLEIARYADHADQLLHRTMTAIDHWRRNEAGVVRVGSFGASASTRLLPAIMKDFAKHHPKILIETIEQTDQETIAALEAGTIDLAITTEPQGLDFDLVDLTSDRLVALVPTKDPMATKAELTAEDLADRPFILTRGGSGNLVLDWFAESGMSPRITHSVQQLTSIFAMVKQGVGVSIVAELSLPETFTGVRVLPLAPEKPRHIVCARLPGGLRSRAAETFWKFCRDHLG